MFNLQLHLNFFLKSKKISETSSVEGFSKMPFFRSRSRSCRRPQTRAASCTTSCVEKPNNFSTPRKPSSPPLSVCPIKKCCCKKPAPVPNCKVKNCCCKKSMPENKKCPPVKFPKSKACERSNPCSVKTRNCEQPSACPLICDSCEKPKSSPVKCGTNLSPPPQKCASTPLKVSTKQSCSRPGCSKRMPCVTCCKTGFIDRPPKCITCKKANCVCR